MQTTPTPTQHAGLVEFDRWVLDRGWTRPDGTTGALSGWGSMVWHYPVTRLREGAWTAHGLHAPQLDLLVSEDAPWRMTLSHAGSAYGGCDRHHRPRVWFRLDPARPEITLTGPDAARTLRGVESHARDLDPDELLLCSMLGACPSPWPGERPR